MKSKKVTTKRKNKPTRKFLLGLLLIPVLFLTVIVMRDQQIFQQRAQTNACGAPGNPGNEKGVGKYCTAGGGQCLGTGSPICSADIDPSRPGLCSKPCFADADCGSGATCYQDTLGKGCKPNVCNEDAPTATPTKAPSPTPSRAPSPQSTNTPTPSPTLAATAAPTLVPTLTSAPSATTAPNAAGLSFTILLHGVGKSGDKANPADALSNKSPQHPNRLFTVSVYNPTNQLVTSKNGTFTYNSGNGNFVGTVDLGNPWTSGNYLIKLKTDSFLEKSLPVMQIGSGQVTVPLQSLVAGDVNNDGVINTLDYNIIMGCYSEANPPLACSDTQKQAADLNDDGQVNRVDYNLFLREI